MLKVMIVEDEQPTLDLMKILIDENSELFVVGSFTNPIEALEKFPAIQPDVVFLDVEMPEMTGIQLAEKLIQVNEDIQIVFTTAYEQYALEAFKVNAVDYLVKFVTSDDIDRVVVRLIKNDKHMNKLNSLEIYKEMPIHCFGTFEVRGVNGLIVKWPTRKTEELFAYFLINPNQIISKWRLMDLLWSKNCAQNLHTTIHRLKKALRENNILLNIQKLNEGYMLEMQSVTCDLVEFRQYFSHHSKVLKENLAESERVFRLYKGNLFEEKDYMWSLALDRDLSEKYIFLTNELATYYMIKNDLSRAEGIIKTCLSLYPEHEKINRLLLKLYALNDHE
ncbi:response regulator [Chengkuizengella sediminis]|uniref:response regulator n=1 Tax=Chengkuizengella sediminis TaxID=1885917 RepID=UPI001389BA62|nr:response regulator [Chengkuizengella sediminis]NDI34412.1 response regulator [Chengkuizengella sediminis]